MTLLFPKPTKRKRPGEIRRRAIENSWPKIRDKRKRDTREEDGTWTCVYCKNRIWTSEECVMAHVIPKGRRPDLKLEPENLWPSHAQCNVTSSPSYKPYRHSNQPDASR